MRRIRLCAPADDRSERDARNRDRTPDTNRPTTFFWRKCGGDERKTERHDQRGAQAPAERASRSASPCYWKSCGQRRQREHCQTDEEPAFAPEAIAETASGDLQ